MNIKRLLIAIVVAFVFIVASDMLIHRVWLGPEYKATHELWRMEDGMTALMPWMFAGQFLIAAAFVVLWAVGLAANAHLLCACLYGLFMGLFMQGNTLITYVVTPIPFDLAVKWFVSGLAQSVLLGIVTFLAYKPKPQA